MSEYKLGCENLGGMDCDFVAEGNTPEETKKILYDHAGQAHQEVLKTMPEEQMKKMDSLMDELLAKN